MTKHFEAMKELADPFEFGQINDGSSTSERRAQNEQDASEIPAAIIEVECIIEMPPFVSHVSVLSLRLSTVYKNGFTRKSYVRV